jgi:hypothetical protein
MSTTLPFNFHYVAAGEAVHSICGGPIVSSRFAMFCLKCNPEKLDIEMGVSKWVLRYLRDNNMLDALIAE